MFSSRKRCACSLAAVAASPPRRPSHGAAEPGYFGYGTPATPEQIAGWDIDVRGDDGAGLPPARARSTGAPRSTPSNARPVMELSAKARAAFPSWSGGVGTLTG